MIRRLSTFTLTPTVLSALALALLTLLPTIAEAQGQPVSRTLGVKFDLDSASYTAVCTTGANNNTLDSPIAGRSRVGNSSSSTTITAEDGTLDIFALLAVGDILWINVSGTTYERRIDTKTSDDEVVLNEAIDLSADDDGYTWGWFDATSTTGDSCWVPVRAFSDWVFTVAVEQISVTGGIDIALQCKPYGTGSAAVTASSVTNVTTAGLSGRIMYYSAPGFRPDACRVVFKIGSADDGTDTGADAEQINVYFTGNLLSR